MLKSVDPKPNFPELEKKHLDRWYSEGILQKYLKKNATSKKKFSFQDGPITANNPMGVHHAWGRTYKDLWQKFYNLLGYKQRFQNGFDCQGLWVEVEVEKELGLKTKKDIENLIPGDSKASVARFVELCKERVKKFAAIQTQQTQRLGNFMDWDHSYFTMSDENNYMIWHFLKVCFEHGWIYKGKDAVPWCPRCETAISQHEMLTEDYKEMTHESVFVKFPITTNGWEKTNLLIWTTTPWSVPADVAVGINTAFTYGIWEDKRTKEKVILLHRDAEGNEPQRIHKKKPISLHEFVLNGVDGEFLFTRGISGKDLLGLVYKAPFDHLDAVVEAKNEHPNTFHTVVDASDIVTAEEGTGLLHVAPSAGGEDFKLGREQNLSVIPVLKDDASYLDGLGEFSGKNAKKHPELIIDYLKDKGFLFKSYHYTHRYPACWRCKNELVWKVADEWYIAMDVPSKKIKKTFREMMQANAKKITWMPEFGRDRELDWLKNMHDWLISKKNRYWGLALPIYECECGAFAVIGSKEELQKKAVEGWEKFDGKTPHKPWIDEVKITCDACGKTTSRIEDVGNPWLDAGIVPYSTISRDNLGKPMYLEDKKEWLTWFPINFITESFPGQFKNWFYALIAMSTALEDKNPFQRVLGYGTLLAEDGRPMHKSWGNSIEFNEGAEKIGVDVMRWMYVRQNPADNMLFGYKKADEVRRSFMLMLWNSYRFYVEYVLLDKFSPKNVLEMPNSSKVLDTWLLHRCIQMTVQVKESLLGYDARQASEIVETFVHDFSTWYIRRSRERVGLDSSDQEDKRNFYTTIHWVLVQLSIVLSPFTPFIAEEIFMNLTGKESVHLEMWSEIKQDVNKDLLSDMALVRSLVEAGHRARKGNKLKVRQPLSQVSFTMPQNFNISDTSQLEQYKKLIMDELNVKEVKIKKKVVAEIEAQYDTNITEELRKEGIAREYIRMVQQERKKLNLQQSDKISLVLPKDFPADAKHEANLASKVGATKIVYGDSLRIAKA